MTNADDAMCRTLVTINVYISNSFMLHKYIYEYLVHNSFKNLSTDAFVF